MCVSPEMRGPENFRSALDSRTSDDSPSCRTRLGTKKPTPSVKKCIVPAIGALAAISLESGLRNPRRVTRRLRFSRR
jgi:hypothetical protein